MDRAIGPLQERKDVLVDLNLALALARSGLGELALVTGEAGAGRIPVTSVLRVSTIIDPTTAERPSRIAGSGTGYEDPTMTPVVVASRQDQ